MQINPAGVGRTPGDTWDIVTSVGLTALGVCAARALDARLDPPLADDEYAARFIAAAGEPRLADELARQDLTGTAAFNAQWVGVRTRFFDDFFQRSIGSGIRQAVILAAGLDCRAYRLDWPTTAVFEVDQPRVLEFKQQVLDQTGAVPSSIRATVAVDLRDDWPAALLEAGFDPALPTAWSAEGLLPYLPGSAQDLLFNRLHQLSAPGSTVAAELGPAPGEIAEFERSVPTMGQDIEQPRFAELWYDDPRLDTKEWLAERNWEVSPVDLMALAADEYGRPLQGFPEVFEQMLRTKYFTAARQS